MRTEFSGNHCDCVAFAKNSHMLKILFYVCVQFFLLDRTHLFFIFIFFPLCIRIIISTGNVQFSKMKTENISVWIRGGKLIRMLCQNVFKCFSYHIVFFLFLFLPDKVICIHFLHLVVQLFYVSVYNAPGSL